MMRRMVSQLVDSWRRMAPNGLRLATFAVRPLYRHVVATLMYSLSLDQIAKIEDNMSILIKQRDDNVLRMYRTLLLLATLLLLIFLMENNIVHFSQRNDVTLFGVPFTVDNRDLFIFVALLVGNFVALMHSTIFVKMFMLEAFIEIFAGLSSELQTGHIQQFSYGFPAFLYGFIAKVGGDAVGPSVRITYRCLHLLNIYGIPLLYIVFYMTCLLIALRLLRFFGTWYGFVLIFFNIYTLSIYAFSFVPCFVRRVSVDQGQALVRAKAYELWEGVGSPDGRSTEIWLLAEKQVRLSGRIK